MSTLYTIGHSNHTLEHFVELLRRHEINAVADVRSSPYSRYLPHFNQASLTAALPAAGITYVFLGKALGARPDDRACYINGRVSYERLAARPEFQDGLQRVLQGAQKFRLALLCAEKDPLDCHRMILVCYRLRGLALDIQHVLANGALESHAEAERRLTARFGLMPNLLDSEADVVEQAYARQAERIAYAAAGDDEPQP